MNRTILLIFTLLLSMEVFPIIPIHKGRFYSNRKNIADTLYLPIDKEYPIKVTVFRVVDSIAKIDNNKYLSKLYSSPFFTSTSSLGDNKGDIDIYTYKVESYKSITLSTAIIRASMDAKPNTKPIDMIYCVQDTSAFYCTYFDSYHHSVEGEEVLKHMYLILYYVQQKIEKEITLVAEESGKILLDDINIVLVPITGNNRNSK
ncbi:MAG: hypothetical protein IJT51_09615 [Bacteroidales bacterium]|nr:hypothetical protein [Bacteroidales bacterium]